MSLDLHSILFGRPMSAGPAHSGRILLTVRCSCARILATVHAGRSGAQVVIRERRFTKAHTAQMLMDAALLDVEIFLERGDGETARTILDFVKLGQTEAFRAAIPSLTIGSTTGELTQLVQVISDEENRAKSVGDVPHPVSNAVPCSKCGKTYSLGIQLAEWHALSPTARPKQLLADTPQFLAKRTSLEMPESTLASRVALYRHINDVLR